MSRLLSRSHTFAIIVILDLKIHQSMWIHWPFFSKNLNQRSLTPRWPLTPCVLRSHVWLYPRIIVSKSHDNTSMYVDTVINFAKYHIHTHTTYIHILLGRGDNLQLFISPLLKYEGWLYNIIDDKNFEINSLESPCTGGLKIPHTPMGTCRNAKN